MRALFAVLGSAAVEGPLIEWVSTHRMHHRFSDRPGDPHSPHADRGAGWRGAVRGLFHAHVGWMFRGGDRADPRALRQGSARRPRDPRGRSHVPASGCSSASRFPFGLGVALTGTVVGGLTGLLWGGAVRILVPAPRDLLDQLALPLLRPAALRHRRRVAQPRLARAADVRRGVAQQPPRLPDLRPPRPHPLAARPRRLADRRPRAARARMGRRAHRAERPAGQADRVGLKPLQGGLTRSRGLRLRRCPG